MTSLFGNGNGDYYIALECKDLQANAMAIDPTGTYVLLAGYVTWFCLVVFF